MELSPVIWNIVLTAAVIILVCTCYEARVLTQWRWSARWRAQALARQRQTDATAAAVAANVELGAHGSARLAPELVAQLPIYSFAAATHQSGEATTRDVESGVDNGIDGITSDGECAICQEAVITDELMCLLPCKHAYHRDCIHAWLARRATCPTCRLDVAAALAPEAPQGAGEQQQQEQQQQQETHTASNDPAQDDDEERMQQDTAGDGQGIQQPPATQPVVAEHGEAQHVGHAAQASDHLPTPSDHPPTPSDHPCVASAANVPGVEQQQQVVGPPVEKHHT